MDFGIDFEKVCKIVKDIRSLADLEFRFIAAIVATELEKRMEKQGMGIDKDILDKHAKEFQDDMEKKRNMENN